MSFDESEFDQMAEQAALEFQLILRVANRYGENDMSLEEGRVNINGMQFDALPLKHASLPEIVTECLSDDNLTRGLWNWTQMLTVDKLLRAEDIHEPLVYFEMWKFSRDEIVTIREQLGDAMRRIERTNGNVQPQFGNEEAEAMRVGCPSSQTDVLVSCFLSGAKTLNEVALVGSKTMNMTAPVVLRARDVMTAMVLPSVTAEVAVVRTGKAHNVESLDRLFTLESDYTQHFSDVTPNWGYRGQEFHGDDPANRFLKQMHDDDYPAVLEAARCIDPGACPCVATSIVVGPPASCDVSKGEAEMTQQSYNDFAYVHTVVVPEPVGIRPMDMITQVCPVRVMDAAHELRIVRYMLFPFDVGVVVGKHPADFDVRLGKPQISEVTSIPTVYPSYPYGPWPLFTYPGHYSTGYANHGLLTVVGIFFCPVTDVFYSPFQLGKEAITVCEVLQSVRQHKRVLFPDTVLELIGRKVLHVEGWARLLAYSSVSKSCRNTISNMLMNSANPSGLPVVEQRIWALPARDFFHRRARQAMWKIAPMLDFASLMTSGLLEPRDVSMLDQYHPTYQHLHGSVAIKDTYYFKPSNPNTANLYSAVNRETFLAAPTVPRRSMVVKKMVYWLTERRKPIANVLKLHSTRMRRRLNALHRRPLPRGYRPGIIFDLNNGAMVGVPIDARLPAAEATNPIDEAMTVDVPVPVGVSIT